jgi:2',3'-cyclic-nucleotide 2'-phosphodiesterase/3'-nucleotidase
LKAAIEQSVNYFTVENDQITVAQDFLVPKVQHFNYDMYSGVEYRCQISRPRGQRLLSLTYHGQPVADDDQLKVVLNRYRAGGGGDYRMFSPAEIVSEVTVDMTELIMQFFAKHDEIKIDARHNFKIIK